MATTLVCVGLTTFDLVQQVAALPLPNQKITALDAWHDVGGPAANAARVASRLGCRVRLVTALGVGPFAALARERLGEIEVIDIAPPEHEFPISNVVLTPDGDRTIISRNAASLVGARLPDPEVLRDADVVLHDGHLLATSLALSNQAAPIQLLDGGSWKPGLDELLTRLDIAVVSGDFAFPGRRPDQALEDLLDAGVPRVARTRGAEPVELRIAGQVPVELPVPRLPAVDTTGAGDVLHGALAACLAQGTDFTASLRQAIEVASRSVTGRGVLAGFEGDAHSGASLRTSQ